MRKIPDPKIPRSTRFAHRITNARHALAYTQADVATLLGVTGSTVTLWENAVTIPQRRQLQPLAQALDLPYRELVELANESIASVNGRRKPIPLPQPDNLIVADTPPPPPRTRVIVHQKDDPRLAIATDIITHLRHLNIALPQHDELPIRDRHYYDSSEYYEHFVDLKRALRRWDEHPANTPPEPDPDDTPF